MCVVIDGEPPFKFTWLKDGKEVTNLEGISTVVVDDFTSTLTIAKLGALSNGNYSCKVSNDAGIDEKYDVLRINGEIIFYHIVKCNDFCMVLYYVIIIIKLRLAYIVNLCLIVIVF